MMFDKRFKNLILCSNLNSDCWVRKDFSVGREPIMICIKAEIPKEICEIDDELKAIYHSHDTVCIWVFKSREDRNNFMNDTVGMKKEEREKHYSDNYG